MLTVVSKWLIITDNQILNFIFALSSYLTQNTISLSDKEQSRQQSRMSVNLCIKCPSFLPDFNRNWQVQTRCSTNAKYEISPKSVLWSGVALFYEDRQIGGQTRWSWQCHDAPKTVKMVRMQYNPLLCSTALTETVRYTYGENRRMKTGKKQTSYTLFLHSPIRHHYTQRGILRHYVIFSNSLFLPLHWPNIHPSYMQSSPYVTSFILRSALPPVS